MYSALAQVKHTRKATGGFKQDDRIQVPDLNSGGLESVHPLNSAELVLKSIKHLFIIYVYEVLTALCSAHQNLANYAAAPGQDSDRNHLC